MKLIHNDGGVVSIELTRRNLLALLAKLDGRPQNSACTIFMDDDTGHLVVTAVNDAEHYSDRPPGEMHPDTEAVLDGTVLDGP